MSVYHKPYWVVSLMASYLSSAKILFKQYVTGRTGL